jgi:hypothetical protein
MDNHTQRVAAGDANRNTPAKSDGQPRVLARIVRTGLPVAGWRLEVEVTDDLTQAERFLLLSMFAPDPAVLRLLDRLGFTDESFQDGDDEWQLLPDGDGIFRSVLA